jgi:hypothetical protein
VFLGHFAVGFASKAVVPRVSLGWLVAAPLFLDLLWPVFVLLGWERVTVVPGDTAFTPLRFDAYPISHSLVTAVGWALLFGGVCWMACRDRRGAEVVAAGVVAWAGLVTVLGLIFLASAFGPPPPSATAVATATLAGWLFPLGAGWLDRRRYAPGGRLP